MSKLIDLTGQRFGRLTVIERAENNKENKPCWICCCDCGNKSIVLGYCLRRGDTRSCGCYSRELSSKRVKQNKPRKVHGGYGTRLYRIWKNMKTRCYNPKFKEYEHYGGRGITICDAWLRDFPAFRDWALSHGYHADLTIDRVDNDKGYSPDNCRWATRYEQTHNRRPPKHEIGIKRKYEINGDWRTSAEWAEIAGISRKRFNKRWAAGKRGLELLAPIKKKNQGGFSK